MSNKVDRLFIEIQPLVSTRRVLLEKYNKFINSILLTNLREGYWQNQNVNLHSVQDAINRLEQNTIYGESVLHGEELNSNISLVNITHYLQNIRLVGHNIYGDIKFLENNEKAMMYEQLLSFQLAKPNIRAFGWVDIDEVTGQQITNINEIITWDLITTI